MKLKVFLLTFFISIQIGFAQIGFQFDAKQDKVVIPFQFINNLIFIPVFVNGVELNFLLDTGVDETILLSLDDKSEVSFNNVKKIKLRGLGASVAIEGLQSSGNVLYCNGLKDSDHELYIVLDQSFNFSSHVGIPVNGIIGYHFFKNHSIEINYDRKKIIVRRDLSKIEKKLTKKFESTSIEMQENKLYCMTSVEMDSKQIETKLLLDIGNSDALWLFQDSNPDIKVPEKSFDDFLGKGFSGDINGKRTKISNFKIANFIFKNPIIAMPDTVSVKSVSMVQNRAGSIGGEIFRRFNVIFDYPNKKLYLRKSSNYNEFFSYNKSGIELENSGMQWVPETIKLSTTYQDNTFDSAGNRAGSSNFRYKFELKPIFSISNIRSKSPAEIVGLKTEDIIISINNTNVNNFSLQKINQLLKSEDEKWITIEVDRKGQILKFRFLLKDLL
jgi:PDZ domain